MGIRITRYEQAFEGLLEIPFDDRLQRFVRRMEADGHTEKSICFSIWKAQDKLRAFRNDPRFLSILENEINKWSWKKDDPRWQEYWKRKEEERKAKALREELQRIEAEGSFIRNLRMALHSEAKPRKRGKKGYIYFVQGVCGGPIKIGYSKNPELRLRELQTGYPDTLTMLLVLPGTEGDESRLHKMFEESRLKGEWFRPDPYVLEKIKEFSQLLQSKKKDQVKCGAAQSE